MLTILTPYSQFHVINSEGGLARGTKAAASCGRQGLMLKSDTTNQTPVLPPTFVWQVTNCLTVHASALSPITQAVGQRDRTAGWMLNLHVVKLSSIPSTIYTIYTGINLCPPRYMDP